MKSDSSHSHWKKFLLFYDINFFITFCTHPFLLNYHNTMIQLFKKIVKLTSFTGHASGRPNIFTMPMASAFVLFIFSHISSTPWKTGIPFFKTRKVTFAVLNSFDSMQVLGTISQLLVSLMLLFWESWKIFKSRYNILSLN